MDPDVPISDIETMRTKIDGTLGQPRLLVTLLDNVSSQLYRYRFSNGKWNSTRVPTPEIATVSITSVSPAAG